ncbi:MAG: SHOCT domain-containing protein [Reichenbachiella sp.]
MKKLLLLPLLFTLHSAFAQVFVEDVDINSLDLKYVQLIGYNKSIFGTAKYKVMIDYGQKPNRMKMEVIRDGSKGEPIIFDSMIGALNHMEQNGWVYKSNYYLSGLGGYYYVFVMERKPKEKSFTSIADELKKLHELVIQKALTNEEFDSQKKKLLQTN